MLGYKNFRTQYNLASITTYKTCIIAQGFYTLIYSSLPSFTYIVRTQNWENWCNKSYFELRSNPMFMIYSNLNSVDLDV